MKIFRILFLTAMLGAVSALFAQTENAPKTEYEKVLEKADRVMFRDRLAIGQIDLESAPAKKAKKGKTTLSGEQLILLTDVAFVPGDTNRFFALDLELVNGSEVLNSCFVELSEMSALRSSLQYMADTGKKIAETLRNDTRLSFHGLSGWSILFNQVGLEQLTVFSLPAHDEYPAVKRVLTLSQLSTLVELLDLAQFDLKRQGATIQKK